MTTTTSTNLVAISGNTYPVKDQLKALGGRWDATQKVWMVPADRADQARTLVSGAASAPATDRPRYRPTRCATCGARSSRYVRIYGYSDRTAKCGACYQEEREEAEMGW